jgi:hypothetical protein
LDYLKLGSCCHVRKQAQNSIQLDKL